MAEIRVRTAVLSDANAIAEVTQRSRAEGFKGVLPAPSLQEPLSWRLHLITEALKDDARAILVAVSGKDIVGQCTYDPWMRDDPPGPKDVSEIKDLYVDPSSWRRGVGRRLLDATINDLRERGSREVVIATFAAAERALAFYAGAGFVKVPDWRVVNFYNGQPMVRLRLSLASERETI
jgi:RimJ/RimL family protein N-acetyltransferase